MICPQCGRKTWFDLVECKNCGWHFAALNDPQPTSSSTETALGPQPCLVSAPTEPSWMRRNWLWALPAGCLGLLVLSVAFVGFVLVVVTSAMKQSDAYREALSCAQRHPAVQTKLGTPVSAGFFVTGSINVSGGSGQADLAIPLSGPRGKATLFAVAVKTAGEWHFSVLVVQITATGERLEILDGLLPTGAKPVSG
jgi:Cytochrome oxidase complex assembly protein 1